MAADDLLGRLRAALRGRPEAPAPADPEAEPGITRVRAAVAVIAAGAPHELALLFIKRAERPGDPWSGHIAFPGGRADPEDSDLRVTAIREAREEVGIALDPDAAEYLGALPTLRLRRRGLPVDGPLVPYVFYAGPARPATIASDEVAGTHWMSLAQLWDAANHTTFEWHRDDVHLVLPGIRLPGAVLWGLTYRILTTLGEACGLPPLPAHPG